MDNVKMTKDERGQWHLEGYTHSTEVSMSKGLGHWVVEVLKKTEDEEVYKRFVTTGGLEKAQEYAMEVSKEMDEGKEHSWEEEYILLWWEWE